MTTFRPHWILAAAVVAGALWCSPASAALRQADSEPAPDASAVDVGVPEFGVFPAGPESARRPRFEYRLQATQALTDVVSIANLGDQPLEVDLYATDALNTTDGGLGLLDRDDVPTGAGSWIRLASEAERIEPGTQVDVPFELDVPAEATPGDHVGGIVAEARAPRSAGGDVGLDVVQRVGARVYLTVDGPMAPRLDVERVEVTRDGGWNPATGSATVRYSIRNNGNVAMGGHVDVSTSGPFGLGVRSAPTVQVPELLPGNEIELEARIDDVAALGRQTATVRMTATSDRTDVEAPPTVIRSSSVWSVPWSVIAGFVIVAIAVVLRRRRRPRGGGSDAGEDVTATVVARRHEPVGS